MAQNPTRIDKVKGRVFGRRVFLMGGVQASLFALLAGRMYQRQVLHRKESQKIAEGNRIKIEVIPPVRGNIVDREGRPLAVSEPSYRAYLRDTPVEDLPHVIAYLQSVFPMSDSEVARVQKEMTEVYGIRKSLISESLSYEQALKLEVNTPLLPGVYIEQAFTRSYPFGAPMAHLIGYMGRPNEKNLKAEEGNPLLRDPSFRLGKSGIERNSEKELRGNPGKIVTEVNVRGRVVREISKTPFATGKTEQLSIDAALQSYIYERLQNEKAATAVVMDVHTGAVLAAVSYPSYDPSLFWRGISVEAYEKLSDPIYTPQLNRAMVGLYPPASTFKIVVALAFLEAGYDPEGFIQDCIGYVTVSERRFHCWKRSGHGKVKLHRALVESCDVWFYEAAVRLGPKRIKAMANRLGLGLKVSDDYQNGETQGLVPDSRWKQAKRSKSWVTGDTLNMAIGQGFVLATPLQMTTMMARLASGGKAIHPHFYRQDKPPAPASLGLNSEYVTQVRQSLFDVVNADNGTAKGALLNIENFKMSGKTGTAQVRRISEKERRKGVLSNDELEWIERDHALFVGYAPSDSPRYACTVVVEHGGSGSSTAAPIARDILQKLYELENKNAGDEA